MNIYQDYTNYMKEFRPLIKQMEATNSPILITFKDVISVNDHICKLVEQNEKVDEELADIFEIGFGFLTNTLEDLKVYYNDYFKKNILPKIIKQGLKLLLNDALGGYGSRGGGRVKFFDLKVDDQALDLNDIAL